jgi:hypothetical protein
MTPVSNALNVFEMVLREKGISDFVYDDNAGLRKTNSSATWLQQAVAPRNKSSQQVWLYPARRQQDHGVTLL